MTLKGQGHGTCEFLLSIWGCKMHFGTIAMPYDFKQERYGNWCSAIRQCIRFIIFQSVYVYWRTNRSYLPLHLTLLTFILFTEWLVKSVSIALNAMLCLQGESETGCNVWDNSLYFSPSLSYHHSAYFCWPLVDHNYPWNVTSTKYVQLLTWRERLNFHIPNI